MKTITTGRWYFFAVCIQGDYRKRLHYRVWDDTAGDWTSGWSALANEMNIEDGDYGVGALGAGTSPHDGEIDELTLWDSFLSDADIDAIKAGTFSGAGAHWAGNWYVDPTSGSDANSGQVYTVPKKTFDTGFPAGSLSNGDTVYIKKSTKVDMGHSDWTNGNSTFVLDNARTANIYACESAWSKTDAAVTVNTNTTYFVEGSKSSYIAVASAFTSGKIAWVDFGAGNELNLSGYTKVSMYIYLLGTAQAAGNIQLKLCSDATGDTALDTLNLPALVGSTSHLIVLDKGSALSNGIRSIALYAVSDPTTPTFYIDNIFATNDLAHGSAVGRDDGWWFCVSSVSTDGLTVGLGYGHSTTNASPYHLATATDVHAYIIEPYRINASASISNLSSGAGLWSQNYLTFQGGWDFSTDSQDSTGMSMFGVAGATTNIAVLTCATKNSIAIDRVGQVGRGYVISVDNSSDYGGHKFSNLCGASTGAGVTVALGSYPGSTHCHRWEGDHYCIGSGQTYVPAYIVGQGSTGTGTINATSNRNIYSVVAIHGDLKYHGTINIYGGPASPDGLRIATTAENVYIDKVNFYNTFNSLLVGDALGAEIGEVNCDATIAYGIQPTVGGSNSSVPIGPIRIGRYIETSGTWAAYIESPYCGNGPILCIDSFKQAGRYITYYSFGTVSDQITGGQNAAWARGGSGLCLYLSPTYVYLPMCVQPIYIPVTAGDDYKVHFYVKKTSSGADCTLKYCISGCGITPIYEQSVTLTDSWEEHTSATVTASEAGYLRLQFMAWDGSTTGDIGIDDIHLVAV
jgi:hypothetical protein